MILAKMQRYFGNNDNGHNHSDRQSEGMNSQYDESPRTVSSDTALDKVETRRKNQKQPQAKKEDASQDESQSYNDARLKSKQANTIKLEIPT